MRETKTHIYFWSGWLSNFKGCNINLVEDDQTLFFNTSEQMYMYNKAKWFDDTENMSLILQASTPRDAKTFGSRVTPFDEEEWNAVSSYHMFCACMCKFMQNRDLMWQLIDTNDKILVEASPYDRIWGVGLAETDDRILDEKNWEGENRLGKVLISVRTRIKRIIEKRNSNIAFDRIER